MSEASGLVRQYSVIIDEIAAKTKLNIKMAESLVAVKNEMEQTMQPHAGQMDMIADASCIVKEAFHAVAAFNRDMDDVLLKLGTLKIIAIASTVPGKAYAPESVRAAHVAGELIADAIEKAKLSARVVNDTTARLAVIVSAIKDG